MCCGLWIYSEVETEMYDSRLTTIWTIVYLIVTIRSWSYCKAICNCFVSAWCSTQGESWKTCLTASQRAKCGEIQNSYAGKASYMTLYYIWGLTKGAVLIIAAPRHYNCNAFIYLFIDRELKEARLAATSPQQTSQPGSLPRAKRKLVGRSVARSVSFGFPGY